MPAEVVPKLYIGSIHASFNQEALVEKGITHVWIQLVFLDVFNLSFRLHRF